MEAQRDLRKNICGFSCAWSDVDGDGEHVLVGIGDGGDAALDIFDDGLSKPMTAASSRMRRPLSQRVDGADGHLVIAAERLRRGRVLRDRSLVLRYAASARLRGRRR